VRRGRVGGRDPTTADEAGIPAWRAWGQGRGEGGRVGGGQGGWVGVGEGLMGTWITSRAVVSHRRQITTSDVCVYRPDTRT
jgi:hypothetical protein